MTVAATCSPRLKLSAHPLERISSLEYESDFNRITGITDPAGNVTTIEYDAQGNLIQTTDPLGGQIVLTYNGSGLPPDHDR